MDTSLNPGQAAEIPFKWEKVGSGHCKRAKVIGGWIFKDSDEGDSVTFIPDETHEWRIKNGT